MKKKSIITMLGLCLGLSMATTSCEDMLTSDSSRHSYDVAQDTLYSYWGILQSLQNIGERYVILGECRGDLVDGSEFTTDSVHAMLSFGLNGDAENIKDGANRYLKVSDYYHIINSCNAYLAQVDRKKEKANGDKYMTRECAQVEAIRAWTYMQLVINYGEVPFYTDPKLTTNDIYKFDSQNPENRVNASNLWQKLESSMMEANRIERAEGYPQYNSYGYNAFLCHSSKTMFPTAVVLADLYLMGNQYEKAASYYYDFFRWSDYGGTLPTNYYSYAYIPQGEVRPKGTWNGYPWDTGAEEEKRSKNQQYESLTAIPSSTNALWGTVQRGVNDLFGFAATIRQNTVDTVTTASITLSQEWDHRQLAPSAGYDALRLSQDFEVYYNVFDGTSINLEKADIKIAVLKNVGDARGVDGETNSNTGFIKTYGSGDYYVGDTQTARYIMKQNPHGLFSTTYPMVYRKSMVWLRFAEALNRAGYPGYAFAILKNGIAKNSEWFPTEETDFLAKTVRVHYEYETKYTNAEGVEKDTVIILPQDWETNDSCLITNDEYDSIANIEDVQKYVTAIIADEHFDTIPVEQKMLYILINTIQEQKVVEYANYQPANTAIVCDYISKDEFEKAKNNSWLDFNNTYFNGQSSLEVIFTRDTTFKDNIGISMTFYDTKAEDETQARGIHQKGCGMLKYNEKNSVYNYVDQINLKLKAAGKRQLTKNEIYDSANKADVIEAIEDLILDEAGLELAFEGNRFFDLMRVANRRSNPGKFMADKIRARGESSKAWANALESDTRNWYLPLPDGSYRK